MTQDDGRSDELLARALLDAGASAAVALKVDGLALAQALTVIFHGRRDLGTIQTYIVNGGRGAGMAVAADELLRGPRGLGLGDAESPAAAADLDAEPARAPRDAPVAAEPR